jgi:hypothetical protein
MFFLLGDFGFDKSFLETGPVRMFPSSSIAYKRAFDFDVEACLSFHALAPRSERYAGLRRVGRLRPEIHWSGFAFNELRRPFTTMSAVTPGFDRTWPRFGSMPDDLSYRRAVSFVLRL